MFFFRFWNDADDDVVVFNIYGTRDQIESSSITWRWALVRCHDKRSIRNSSLYYWIWYGGKYIHCFFFNFLFHPFLPSLLTVVFLNRFLVAFIYTATKKIIIFFSCYLCYRQTAFITSNQLHGKPRNFKFMVRNSSNSYRLEITHIHIQTQKHQHWIQFITIWQT